MTAALALSGPLSIRYPDIAFEQLWFLTTRGSQVDVVARVSLSLMLSSAADDTDRALTILHRTAAALRWTNENSTAMVRRGAASTVLTVLAAPSFTAAELVIGDFLRTSPEATETIGTMFAAVLESGPHHHRAVDLLRRLLSEFGDGDEALAIAARLGSAIFTLWSQPTRHVLIPQIERALALAERDADMSRQIVKVFIHSIDAHQQ
jgi:hypothetical protein